MEISDKKLPPLFDSDAGALLLGAWKTRLACVATDVDGTLTIEDPEAPARARGCLSTKAYASIRRLTERGIPVILVSGRPLPTIEGLAMYMGLVSRERTESGCALIGENGAVAKVGGRMMRFCGRESALLAVRKMCEAQSTAPDTVLTFDNYLRTCDVGIDSAAIRPEVVREHLAGRDGLGLKAITSNIMSHVVSSRISKATALKTVLSELGISNEDTAVFGDSETDAALMEAFPMSVGVANYFTTYPNWEKFPPAMRSRRPGGAGFAEVVECLL